MGTCTKLIIQDVNFGKTPTNIICGTRRDAISTSTLRRRITVDIQLNGINTLHPLSPLSPLDIAIHPLDMRINLMEMIMNPLSTRIQSEDMNIKPVNIGINGTPPQLRKPTINQRHLTRNRKRFGTAGSITGGLLQPQSHPVPVAAALPFLRSLRRGTEHHTHPASRTVP
jgi:hypothetical protein